MKKSVWMLLSVFIVAVGLFSLIASILVAPHIADMASRVVLIALGVILFLLGFILAVSIEYQISVYECRACGKTFKPTLGAYCAGAHTLKSRYLKCPHCGKKHFAVWRLEE